MKAVRADAYGGSDVLKVVSDIPQPKPAKGQVLVEIYAAGINPFDIHIISGLYKKTIPMQFPMTPGGDFAGIIRGIGEDISGYSAGDEVFGTAIAISGGTGSWAEFALVMSGKFSKKPETMDFTETAALPVAALTAVEAIDDHAKLTRGQKILIHGGAGGVGHFALQYAKTKAAYVATTVGSDDMDFVMTMGADEVIDYKKQDFSELLSNYDAVIDVIGGEVNTKSYRVLKPGGILVTTKGQSNEALEKKFNVRTVKQSTVHDQVHLARLAKLVSEGKIKPHIDEIFPLESIKDAYIHQTSGHPRGKVVVKIKE